MIYVCIPSHNEAATVGLVLWKIRKVFEEFPREYQILVVDDGSEDPSAEVLESYTRVLPLTVIGWKQRLGYARSVEALLLRALELSDRPRRDSAVLMSADLSHSAQYLPDFVRRLESGADVVVGEASRSREAGGPGGVAGHRWARRWASLLLGRVKVQGVSDPVSGFVAFRLATLRQALGNGGSRGGTGGREGDQGGRAARPLVTDGWAANAELVGRAAQTARRVETIPVVERYDLRHRESRIRPWETFGQAWRARQLLRREWAAAGERASP